VAMTSNQKRLNKARHWTLLKVLSYVI